MTPPSCCCSEPKLVFNLNSVEEFSVECFLFCADLLKIFNLTWRVLCFHALPWRLRVGVGVRGEGWG